MTMIASAHPLYNIVIQSCVLFYVSVPPPPLPLTFHRSRNSTLNAGTSFSLTCLITPNRTGVDTAFTVQSTITGPTTPDSERVTVSQTMPVRGVVYETVITFAHLLEEDTGSYNCSVELTPAQPYVIASNPVSATEHISIGRKL